MKLKEQGENPAAWIEATINTFINSSPENSLRNERNDRVWADPLVGFSRGDDPFYHAFKDHIGPFYWTPLEIFTKTFPSLKAKPDELSVISWVLPIAAKTRQSNRRHKDIPSPPGRAPAGTANTLTTPCGNT